MNDDNDKTQRDDLKLYSSGINEKSTKRDDDSIISSGITEDNTSTNSTRIISSGILNTTKNEIILNNISYKIIKELTKSTGEAEVYLLEQNGEKLVFKFYYPKFKPKTDLLVKLKDIKHEDIINLIDYGYYEGRFYELQEYAEGGSLSDKNDDGSFKYLPINNIDTIKQIIKEIVNSFKYCHDNGIVHRDIKPENIFYKNTDGTDILIGDFGISSMLDEGLTRHMTGQARTAIYAAPEIYQNVKGKSIIGKEIDYYSLGITLIYLWSGEEPFSGLAELAIMHAKARGLLDIPQNMPVALKNLIKGLTVINPKYRWCYDEVQKWLIGENVSIYEDIIQSQYSSYIFKEIKNRTKIIANNPVELSDLLHKYPDDGKKHLYRNLISKWLEKDNPALSNKIYDIVEEETNQDIGVIQAIYTLDPDRNFITKGGIECKTAIEAGNAFVKEKDYYKKELTNINCEFYIWLKIKGYDDLLNLCEKTIPDWQDEDNIFNIIISVLEGTITDPIEVLRFIDNGNGTITDRETGLMWQQDGSTYKNWSDAWYYCRRLRLAGYSDWRLPKIEELKPLFDHSEKRITSSKYLENIGFKNIFSSSDYWSASVSANESNSVLVYSIYYKEEDKKVKIGRDLDFMKNRLHSIAVRFYDKKKEFISSINNCEFYKAKSLIKSGADVNLKDATGNTVLMLATQSGKDFMVKLLIKSGADVNLKDTNGKTALMLATQTRKKDIVKLLIKAGADINLKDESGKTALMLATQSGKKDIVKLLIKAGADISNSPEHQKFKKRLRQLKKIKKITLAFTFALLIAVTAFFINHLDDKSQMFIKETDSIKYMQISPDGKHLALAVGTEIKIYNFQNRQHIENVDLERSIYKFSYSPDGKLIIISAVIQFNRVFKRLHVVTLKPKRFIQTVLLEDYNYDNIRISKCGKYLLYVSNNSFVNVFYIPNFSIIRRYQENGDISNITLSSDGKYYAALFYIDRPRIIIRDIISGNILKSIKITSEIQYHSIEFTKDAKYILISNNFNTEIYSLTLGTIVKTISTPDTSYFQGITFSSDGRYFFKFGTTLTMWDFTSGKLLFTVGPILLTNPVFFQPIITPDGKHFIAIRGVDGAYDYPKNYYIKIWKIKSD